MWRRWSPRESNSSPRRRALLRPFSETQSDHGSYQRHQDSGVWQRCLCALPVPHLSAARPRPALPRSNWISVFWAGGGARLCSSDAHSNHAEPMGRCPSRRHQTHSLRSGFCVWGSTQHAGTLRTARAEDRRAFFRCYVSRDGLYMSEDSARRT